MKLTSLHIENFRSISDLTLAFDDTTVLIGPNNAGKSAILEALRIALSRRWGQQGTGFVENDVRREVDATDPRSAPSVRVTLAFNEPELNAWPADMVANLEDILVLAADGRNELKVSVSYAWNPEKDAFESGWQFLNPQGDPLPPRRRAMNLSGLFDYIRFYWLGALRDADDEFTARSRHWGPLLRSMNISSSLESEIRETLNNLDGRLLAADPRLQDIASTIGNATHVAIDASPGSARLRMLPLDVWDLLARAGIVLRNDDHGPWLPLGHQGQGIQSLAVIFLLSAAMSHQLAQDGPDGAEPIFAIEEPEVHLHPQAARTLWERIRALPGQKIVTTHSPYFVQHVPLHNLRLCRHQSGVTQVTALPRAISSPLPWTEKVAQYVAAESIGYLVNDPATNTVSATRWLDPTVVEGLGACWRGESDYSIRESQVATLRHDARCLISEGDETALSILGRRVRGEIFFARHWLLVEGPCEYLLLHAIGRGLSYDLDQHGVAVIDFQNSGNPGIYAALAEGLTIPWRMVVDGDQGGPPMRAQLTKRGFTDADLLTRVAALPAPHDLEDQLLVDGHEALLRAILAECGIEDALTSSLPAFTRQLKKHKTAYMSELARRVSSDHVLASTMPVPFVALVTALRDSTT